MSEPNHWPEAEALYDAEQAVIEAAESWLAWGYKDVARSAYSPETWEEKLAKAVRALQEARDE